VQAECSPAAIEKSTGSQLSGSGGNEMTTAKVNRRAADSAAIEIKGWSDRALLDACIRKDERAWEELQRRYDDSLRGAAYKMLQPWHKSIPSDFRDDILGAFYLKLVENDMAAVRSFDWEKGAALFKWFAFLVAQSAIGYLGTELDHASEYAPLADGLEVAD